MSSDETGGSSLDFGLKFNLLPPDVEALLSACGLPTAVVFAPGLPLSLSDDLLPSLSAKALSIACCITLSLQHYLQLLPGADVNILS